MPWADFWAACFFFHLLAICFSEKETFAVFYVDQLVDLLVCLVCQETMAVKNFVLGKTGLAVM